MGSSSEVGASEVKIQCYKCSIKEVTVSAEWKASGAEISEQAVAKVFDSTKPERTKTIYLISSPQGVKPKIKTVRDAGGCPRENHRKYRMRWNEYTYVPQDKPSKPQIIPLSMPWKPYIVKSIPMSQDTEIQQEEELNIKCFEIGGALEALNFLPLPIPLNINTSTTCLYASCKEGAFNYNIVSYPDIKFKLEIEIGTDEAKKKRGGFSHFKSESFKLKRVLPNAKKRIDDAWGTEVKFCPPCVSFLTTYNGKKNGIERSKLEFKIDFDTDKEFINFLYHHDGRDVGFGSQGIQEIPRLIDKIKGLCLLIKYFCNSDFLKEFINFDVAKLQYKPWEFKLNTPSIDITFEGQYHTSKNLTRIGRLFDICVACSPLLGVTLTIDLLYLILTSLSMGTATGIYLMLTNLDKVLEKIFGKKYKEEHNISAPFKADIDLKLIITGAVNGDAHWFIDTTEEKNANSTSGSIEGEIKVDLEAGIRGGVDVFAIQVEGELSATASAGIKLLVGFENRILQGEGLAALFDIIFAGLKIKYVVYYKIGLAKTYKWGRDMNGEEKLLEKKSLFSTSKVFFEEKGKSNNENSAGAGGGSSETW